MWDDIETDYELDIHQPRIIKGVLQNDLQYLQTLIGSKTRGSYINSVDIYQNTPLHISILTQKWDIFKYLLTIDGIDINQRNNESETPLCCALRLKRREYAETLIEKGADVCLATVTDSGPLHFAVTDPNLLDLAESILEKRVDVNAQDENGCTPLHCAAEYGSIESLHLLMCYSADPLIYDQSMSTPFTILNENRVKFRGSNIEDIMFDYTFPIGCSLHIKVFSLTYNNEKFLKLTELARDVYYDVHDLRRFGWRLTYLPLHCFKAFFHKFPDVILDFLKNVSIVGHYFQCARDQHQAAQSCMEVVEFLIQTLPNVHSLPDIDTNPTNLSLIIFSNKFNIHSVKNLTLEALEAFICFILSYGYEINSNDLRVLHQLYGYCPLFKKLLHMDVKITPKKPDSSESMIPRLIFDVTCDTDSVVNRVGSTSQSVDLSLMLNYINHPKIKKLLVQKGSKAEIDQVEEMPSLPSLVQLSRDAARKHIISVFKVRNCRDYHTYVAALPIPSLYKEILTFERRVYDFC